MLYDLSSELQRESFLVRVEQLLTKRCVVELTEKTFRTRNQNSYLHLLLGVVAMETGNTLADVKEYYFRRYATLISSIGSTLTSWGTALTPSGHPLTSPRRRCQWQLTGSSGGERKMGYTCRTQETSHSSGRLKYKWAETKHIWEDNYGRIVC